MQLDPITLGKIGTRGAVVAIALYLVWRLAATFDVIPQIAAEIKAHRSYEAESLSVGRRSCRALQHLARLDPDQCDWPAGGHP